MSVAARLLEQRHAYDRALLALEVLVLLGLRGRQAAPRLVRGIDRLISGMAVLLDSPLLPKNRLPALAKVPFFSLDLVIGIAAGYLLVGFTGGIVLNSQLVLDPSAFHLEASAHSLPDGAGHAPAMLGASFASLTTLGSPLLNTGSLTLINASTGITIVGQLYIAILIAGILGKPRRTEAIPLAAHRGRRPASGSRKIRLRNR